MTTEDYQRLLLKYRGPFAGIRPDILADVALLLAHIETQNRTLRRQHGEIRSAVRTMQAITKAVGVVEIPVALLDSLHEHDGLHIEDAPTAHGPVRRFSYRPFEGEAIGATRAVQ